MAPSAGRPRPPRAVREPEQRPLALFRIWRPDPVQLVEPEPGGGDCRPYRGPAGVRRRLLRDRLDRPLDGWPRDAGREPVWLRGQDPRAGVAAPAPVHSTGR